MADQSQRASDIAAAKMGQLLLQGFRMLDATCVYCSTVLMQDRSGKNICVLCGDSQTSMEMHDSNDQASSSRRGQKHQMDDSDLPTAVKKGLKLGPALEDADLSTVVADVAKEMKATASYLEVARERQDAMQLADRHQLLKHVQLCVQILADIKSLQQ